MNQRELENFMNGTNNPYTKEFGSLIQKNLDPSYKTTSIQKNTCKKGREILIQK